MDTGEHPSDCGVAAPVAVIAAQCRVNGDAADTLGGPVLDLGAIRAYSSDREQ